MKCLIVISSGHKISDDFATKFSELFYSELLTGSSVQQAFDKTMNYMKMSREKDCHTCCCGHDHKPWCRWMQKSKAEKSLGYVTPAHPGAQPARGFLWVSESLQANPPPGLRLVRQVLPGVRRHRPRRRVHQVHQRNRSLVLLLLSRHLPRRGCQDKADVPGRRPFARPDSRFSEPPRRRDPNGQPELLREREVPVSHPDRPEQAAARPESAVLQREEASDLPDRRREVGQDYHLQVLRKPHAGETQVHEPPVHQHPHSGQDRQSEPAEEQADRLPQSDRRRPEDPARAVSLHPGQHGRADQEPLERGAAAAHRVHRADQLQLHHHDPVRLAAEDPQQLRGDAEDPALHAADGGQVHQHVRRPLPAHAREERLRSGQDRPLLEEALHGPRAAADGRPDQVGQAAQADRGADAREAARGPARAADHRRQPRDKAERVRGRVPADDPQVPSRHPARSAKST